MNGFAPTPSGQYESDWENEYWEKWGKLATHPLANGLKTYIAAEKKKSYEEGFAAGAEATVVKAIKGTVGYDLGRKEYKAEVLLDIEDMMLPDHFPHLSKRPNWNAALQALKEKLLK